MDYPHVVQVGQDLFYTVMLLALPSLGVSLVVGIVISILQAITSIQEQTLSFAPRLLAVGMVLVFTLSWSLQVAVHFTLRMMEMALSATR